MSDKIESNQPLIADWDYLVLIGLILAITGIYLMYGIGAALLIAGVALRIAGIGGALGRTNGRTE